MECISKMAQATVEAKEEDPMGEKTTHIIMRFVSQNRDDLYRAADGMLVASRQNEIVRFGVDPRCAESRFFMNAPKAAEWIRSLAGVDLAACAGGLTVQEQLLTHDPRDLPDHKPFIEERDAESLIALPYGDPVKVLRN